MTWPRKLAGDRIANRCEILPDRSTCARRPRTAARRLPAASLEFEQMQRHAGEGDPRDERVGTMPPEDGAALLVLQECGGGEAGSVVADQRQVDQDDLKQRREVEGLRDQD